MPHDYTTDPAIRWLGPYAPEDEMVGYKSKKMLTDRHADDITISHIIDLRKNIEDLKDDIKKMLDVFKVIQDHSTDDTAKLLSKAVLLEEEKKWKP